LIGAFLAEEEHFVGGDGLVQRRALGFPVGQQFGQRLRVHHRAREDVRAGLGAFFEHHDGKLRSLFGRQLFQANRGGQAAGAAAHHDHVVFHRLTGAELGQNFLGIHRGTR
jgi:hypothetical protein